MPAEGTGVGGGGRCSVTRATMLFPVPWWGVHAGKLSTAHADEGRWSGGRGEPCSHKGYIMSCALVVANQLARVTAWESSLVILMLILQLDRSPCWWLCARHGGCTWSAGGGDGTVSVYGHLVKGCSDRSKGMCACHVI